MYAVILAGGKVAPGNKLYAESKGLPKALIELQGKSMVQWVIDAANKANSLEKLIIVGLPVRNEIKSKKPLHQLPDQGGIIENLAAAAKLVLKEKPGTEYFLGISADIPLITAEIIESVLSAYREPGFDIFYHVVEKKLMENSFPGVKRTYIRFKNGWFCGADMHIISPNAFIRPVAFKFVTYRKNPWKLISLVGFYNLLRMIFCPPALEQAEKVILQQTGLMAKPVICKFPEPGMDIDTVHHLEIARERLSKNAANEK